MSETQTPYLEALIARPADPAAAAVVVQRKIAELTKRLDAANRRGDRWRDHCAGLIVGVRRATQEANDLLALNRTVTADRDEGLALNNRLNSRVLALTGANKTLLHLLADSQTKADQRGQLNRALAADLEQCERENANLQTLSLLDADRAISRLTEIAALTDANGILQNQVTGLDAETETQEDMIHDLEARLSLCEGRCPQQEPPHLEPPEGVSARQCPSCGMWFWSDVGATTHCLSCQRAMACDEQNEDEDKQSPDPMADLLRLGNMVYLP